MDARLIHLGQRHHGPLLESLEAEMVRHERVEHAERIEELAPPATLKPILAPDVGAGCRHIAIAVHDQQGAPAGRANRAR